MIKKKITVQISEGLGNQLFMYAHAYSLSKKLNYELFLDTNSGYQKKKNLLRGHQIYMLDNFNLIGSKVYNDILINSYFSYILKKIFLSFDKFKSKKTFYIENQKKIKGIKTIDKITTFKPSELANNIYINGNFENQIYFQDYKNDLIKIFKPKHEKINQQNPLINQLQNTNSVSIHIRRNRFSDQAGLTDNKLFGSESKKFTNESIKYINKAINYFNNKIDNPKYFIWSNDHHDINKFTKNLIISDFQLVQNNDAINDFYLFSFSKHFIVSPSSFHWWGAWLNTNKAKICLYPSNLNPSNNFDFWPKEWVSI
jgi:hypothetical protein